MKNYKEEKKKKNLTEVNNCLDEVNRILKKYDYKVDISEWLVFTNKNGSFSFETNKDGLLVVQ